MEQIQLKIFLSSTFDEKMIKNRDCFRNEINARLNHIIGQIGGNIYLRDFELGIPKETQKVQILNYCFDEINKCDYFICILGDYYGKNINDFIELWNCADIEYDKLIKLPEIEKFSIEQMEILKDIYNYIKKDFNDSKFSLDSAEKIITLVRCISDSKYRDLIKTAINNNLSVLELEIIEALNKSKSMVFYMPKGLYKNSTVKNIKKLVQKIKSFGYYIGYYIYEFEDETDLKNQVVTYFENYFKKMFVDLFNKYTVEQKDENIFFSNKLRYYVDNSKPLCKIDEYVNNNSRKVFVLKGESGSGKSTILSKWVMQHRNSEKVKLIYIFVGTNKRSISEILKYILKELYEQTHQDFAEIKVISSETTLLDKFYSYLNTYKINDIKFVILIDGFEHIEFTDSHKGMYWLPLSLPESTKLIISSNDTNLINNKYEIYEIDTIQSIDIIENILDLEGKRLEFQRFKNKIQQERFDKTLPIYNWLLTNEILMTAKFDDIDEIIEKYIDKSLNIKELYLRYIERIERRYIGGMFKEICIYLYCSQNGLNEDSLKVLVGAEDVLEPIYLTYFNFSKNSKGNYLFQNLYFKEAIRERYLQDKSFNFYREKLLELFKNVIKSDDFDIINEISYQAYQLNNCVLMEEIIKDINISIKLFDYNEIKFLEYITVINSRKSILDNWVSCMYQCYSESFYQNYCFANLLNSISEYKMALKWYKKSLTMCKRIHGQCSEEISDLCNQIAVNYYYQGNYSKALEWYMKSYNIALMLYGEKHTETATIYNNIAMIYYRLGEYKGALKWYKKGLKVDEKILGKEHPRTLITNNNLALLFNGMGQYKKSLKLYKYVIKMNDEVLDENHPTVATSYSNAALVYARIGRFKKALGLHKKALVIREKVLGKEHPDTAMLYNCMAEIHLQQGKHCKALKLSLYSLNILEKVLGKEHADTAILYDNIGKIYSIQGDYKRALEFLVDAINTRKKVLGKNSPELASTYSNIASVYDHQGKIQKALKWYKKAVAIQEEQLGMEHLNTATTYNNIGTIYSQMGDFDEALIWYGKALCIETKILGQKNVKIATRYNNIAVVYRHQTKFKEAIECYKEAIKINIKVFGIEHKSIATLYNNVAVVYSDIGMYDEALEFYLLALNIEKKVSGNDHPDVAEKYNNIGILYYHMEKYEKALEYLKIAETLCIIKLDETHPLIASIYNNLGLVYSRQENYEMALKWHKKSLAINEEEKGKTHIDVANNYNNIASIYTYQGDYQKAVELFKKALNIFEKVLGIEHPTTGMAYNNIAAVFFYQGLYSVALTWFRKALLVLRDVLGIEHQDTRILLDNIKQTSLLAGENNEDFEE